MSMKMKTDISIALCTYNGERFLRDQLESFVKQTVLPYEMVVCDDCSSDLTVDILEKFADRAPFPVRIIRNESNLGLIKNFSKAASLIEGNYIAFSDQDDIWLPDKLEACYYLMRRAEETYGSHIPILVHSDLYMIDEHRQVISSSYLKMLGLKHRGTDPLKTLLARNFVLGCTCLCNRILIKESLPFPEIITNHDGWLAMIAASRGKILFIRDAKVLYRQHGGNVTAWTTSFSYWNYFKSLVNRRIDKERASTSLVAFLDQAKVLKKHLISLSPSEAPHFLDIYIDAVEKGGIRSSFKLILSGIHQPGFVPNLLFLYRIARAKHVALLRSSDPKTL